MATPTRKEIVERATELYFLECHRGGQETPNLPEISELKEEGFIDQAASELMRKPIGYEVEWNSVAKPQETLQKNQIETDVPFDVEEAMASGFFVSGTSQCGKSTLAKLLVSKLMLKGIMVKVVDPSRSWLKPDSPIKRQVIIQRPTQGSESYQIPLASCVIDVSRLTYDQRFSFVMSTCNGAFSSHMNGLGKREVLVFEEAHLVFPNGCFRSTRKYSPALDVVTVGGNFGLRFGCITQFAALLDKTVVKMAQQRYFGWTTEKNDKAYVQSFVGKENLRDLVGLRRGEFLYQYRGETEKVKVPQLSMEICNFALAPQQSRNISVHGWWN